MNRYELQKAKDKIMSYYLPRPHEEANGDKKTPFERAKAEWLKHAKQQIDNVEAFSFDDFLRTRG